MTKKLNAAAIMNELAGQSAFFRRPTPPPAEPPTNEAQKPPAIRPENSPVSGSVLPPKSPQDENLSISPPPPSLDTQTRLVKYLAPASRDAGLPANQQTDKPANPQDSLPANQQGSKPENQQAYKPASLQTSKQVKKFSSYLSEESIRALKRLALDEDKKDYEVLQEALDEYLQKKGPRAK